MSRKHDHEFATSVNLMRLLDPHTPMSAPNVSRAIDDVTKGKIRGIRCERCLKHTHTFHIDGSPHCAKCLPSASLRRCARCRIVFYCTKECQKAHWDRHKRACTAALAEQNDPVKTGSSRFHDLQRWCSENVELFNISALKAMEALVSNPSTSTRDSEIRILFVYVDGVNRSSPSAIASGSGDQSVMTYKIKGQRYLTLAEAHQVLGGMYDKIRSPPQPGTGALFKLDSVVDMLAATLHEELDVMVAPTPGIMPVVIVDEVLRFPESFYLIRLADVV